MKKLFLVLLTINSILQTVHAQTGPALLLSTACSLAYKHRPSLQALKFSTEEQKMLAKKELSGYLPGISLVSSSAVGSQLKGINTDITVRGQQLIYSFAGPMELYKISKKNKELAVLAEQAHKDLIRFQTEQAFFMGWLSVKKLTREITRKRSSQGIFMQRKLENDVALLDKSRWLESKAVFAQATAQVQSLDDEVASRQSSLEQALGKQLAAPLLSMATIKNKKPTTRLVWNPHLPIHFLSRAHYVQEAHNHRKELQIKEKEIEREARTENYWYKTYLPNLHLVSDVHRTHARSGTYVTSRVGAQVSWNFFDGFANRWAGQAAHARMMRARLEYHSTEQSIRREVEHAYDKAQSAYKLLWAQTATVKKSHNDIILRKKEHEIGIITQTEVDQTVFVYHANYFDWLQKRVDLELAYRRLLFSCGYPPSFDEKKEMSLTKKAYYHKS